LNPRRYVSENLSVAGRHFRVQSGRAAHVSVIQDKEQIIPDRRLLQPVRVYDDAIDLHIA